MIAIKHATGEVFPDPQGHLAKTPGFTVRTETAAEAALMAGGPVIVGNDGVLVRKPPVVPPINAQLLQLLHTIPDGPDHDAAVDLGAAIEFMNKNGLAANVPNRIRRFDPGTSPVLAAAKAVALALLPSS